ncbi:sulfotransferase [Marinoscillum pacificum]|uniref:sulfotransferase n=1 Tax=Marinoscillum pacificum TaxID=392723 RepID=UPI0021570A1E|nr:sulfotransferase [Marinoscillum pacificum]
MIYLSRNKKIFCIGLNKTGTTTLEFCLDELGFRMGDQLKAKPLLDDWAKRNFKPIIKYCKSADAFQDSPFSLPHTYLALHSAFPRAKFILSVRNNPDQWADSITTFHGKLWANGNTPTKEDLQNAINHTKGRPWKVNRLLFNTPEDDPYNRDVLKVFYDNHNRNVVDYFKTLPGSLLVLNVAKKESYRDFCEFLNVKPMRELFPIKNSTSDLKL